MRSFPRKLKKSGQKTAQLPLTTWSPSTNFPPALERQRHEKCVLSKIFGVQTVQNKQLETIKPMILCSSFGRRGRAMWSNRNAQRTWAWWLAGALAVGTWAAEDSAFGWPGGESWWTPVLLAQSQQDLRAQQADLLARAREAIRQGQWEVAEQLIQQAEQIPVRPNPLNPLADTPEKVRRELQRRRKGQGSGLSRFLPRLGSGQQKPPQDPFAGATSTPLTPPPGGTAPAATVATPAARLQQAQSLLVQARKALAVGDVRRAQTLVQQARALQVSFPPLGDNPDRVQHAINTYQQLRQAAQTSGSTLAFRRQQAQFLLDQASWLLRAGELDEAERLAHEAQRLGVSYSPYELNPQGLLAQIDRIRRRAQAQPTSGPVLRFAPGAISPEVAQKKQHVQRLLAQAREAIRQKRWDQATALLRQAESLGVPAAAYGPRDDRPELVRRDLTRAMKRQNSAAATPAAHITGTQHPRVLFQQAEAALQRGQLDLARRLFLEAEKHQDQLDPTTRQQLQGRLAYLGRQSPEELRQVSQQQALLRKQVSARLADAQRRARELRDQNPQAALMVLEEARVMVQNSPLDPEAKQQLLYRVDGDIEQLRRYMAENAPLLELQQRNQQVLADLQRQRRHRVEVQQRLAELVDEFNRLMDQQRFAEAELVARKAEELAPDEPIVAQLKWQSRFVRRIMQNAQIRDEAEQGFVDALASVQESAIPFDDRQPIQFPTTWEELTRRRKPFRGTRQRSPKELEIEQKLRTPVSLRFKDTPLHEVIDYLSRLADVNIHLDPQGLAEEGVNPDVPVTIELNSEIQLKSALNLILEPLHLGYVIKDEVLKITSERARSGEVYTVIYDVADLVVPIPNFLPDPNAGLAGALRNAYQNALFPLASRAAPVSILASKDGDPATNVVIDKAVLAQLAAPGGGNAGAMPDLGGIATPGGPGGTNQGAQPDFDSLIQLITSTVAPDTWAENGGPGTIAPFEGNFSLVISQTEEVHQQIEDLLNQLRRLMDLQVTIEVRFITLNDNFFERIGVDFDFDIDDDIDRPFQVFGRPAEQATLFAPPGSMAVGAGNPPRNVQDRDHGPTVMVGMSAPGLFSADLDIPVSQGSFDLAVPQFGGFQPGAGAQLGFAILSDLEAYFFIEASQGDRRSNVLQAPKVTLMNGQAATVSDFTFSPFVISVIPVVGDFAVAQQPVIMVLNEGTQLSVQAAVSADRRFVRLTVMPTFNTIGNVEEFTFSGSQSTSETYGPVGEVVPNRPTQRVQSQQGTTVQLPSFSIFNVATTVSVPDGGTVLLGGIKRLAEGRNEFGVPILSKLPYVNRLFRNVGIGRETQSLLMLVTPRIIINEEEERIQTGLGQP